MRTDLVVELIQLLVLAASAAIFLATARQGTRRDRPWSLLLALATLAAFCRELDPDLMGEPWLEAITWVGRKVIYRGVIALAVAALVLGLLRQPSGVRRWLHPRLLGCWIAAIALLVAGSVMEKHGTMLLEEVLELAGEALVLVSALVHRQVVRAGPGWAARGRPHASTPGAQPARLGAAAELSRPLGAPRGPSPKLR